MNVSRSALLEGRDTDGNPVKLITSFLLSYPLAGLLKRIPDAKPIYKNYFIIGCVN